MPRFIAILVLAYISVSVFSQEKQDSTVDRQNKVIKEAPESLQKLLENIKESELNKVNSTSDIEIDGLLLDETKTKSGRDFYFFFYQNWNPPANAKNYSIFIKEKPYRLTTTLIEIKINESLVFKSFLQPRNEMVKALAQQAVERTYAYLKNYEELQKQLMGEDQSGTGIF
ncbi:CsgE family curli-type amyloid fiber assembly protein [Carboxylicivirga marina]|uniref:Curli production assembly/transport component CsgE n=1 Tax=Carboxylicivirga marina TaxID=2800988 RepID=A0ABS1HGZ9_9BACT|nr:CsgE family curli-type amyloid fiber assembly protein [Carboxylicivirga marina]MBK3516947.1 hypothetical protein [Carboxylicivirga marina]